MQFECCVYVSVPVNSIPLRPALRPHHIFCVHSLRFILRLMIPNGISKNSTGWKIRFPISHTHIHIHLSFANMERFLAGLVLASKTISLFHSSSNILLVVLLPKLVRVIVASRVKLVLFTYTQRTLSLSS